MRRGISENVKFGIQLCLEEAISNVIRHGYENVAGLEVRVSFNEPLPGKLIFAVEDDAPQFNPLKQLPPATGSHSWPDRIGGQGIRLMCGFASSLEYEALDGGNRLLIGFDRG